MYFNPPFEHILGHLTLNWPRPHHGRTWWPHERSPYWPLRCPAVRPGPTSGWAEPATGTPGLLSTPARYCKTEGDLVYYRLEQSWPWSCTWMDYGQPWSIQVIPWTQAQNLQNNLNIDRQVIHNLAHLLYSNRYRSCFIDHVLDIPHGIGGRIDSSQDYVLWADQSWHQITLGISTTRSIP